MSIRLVLCLTRVRACSLHTPRYFAFHTEIAWSKEMRGTYDHMGLDDARASKHTNRLLYSGIMDRNKRDVNVFPFNFVPMGGAAAAPLTRRSSRCPAPYSDACKHIHISRLALIACDFALRASHAQLSSRSARCPTRITTARIDGHNARLYGGGSGNSRL